MRRKFTVDLFLPDEAVAVFEKYKKNMRGYINDRGDLPFRNMTDEELFQTAIFLGSDRMVSDKLWDAALAAHAIDFEEYKTRILKEQINVESGADYKGGAAEGEDQELVGAGGQNRDIQGNNEQESKEAKGLHSEGATPDSVNHFANSG